MKTKSAKTTAVQKPVKQLMPKTGDTHILGNERLWEKMPIENDRKLAMTCALSWYNYYYNNKDAKQFTIDWMSRNGFSVSDCKSFARAREQTFPTTLGWICRMSSVGWQFNERDSRYVVDSIQKLMAEGKTLDKPDTGTSSIAKPNIQDYLREKMQEAAGEIESMFDDMIAAGGKLTADFKPMSIIRGANVAPQMVGEIAEHWQGVVAELNEVVRGKDSSLVEGYSNFSKIQIRNMIKFAEQVIADCASYVQIKKVERKPRKKKAVSPEKLTARFKYLKEFPELDLKSIAVTNLVNASEAWFYDTKRRKLIHVQPEAIVGSFSVKGSAIIGFDPTNSVRKTLRKPKEQIKALLAAGAPAARKIFKDIKATETKFNGRGNPDIIILRVR